MAKFRKKPIVIDATALSLLTLKSLHKNALLTPHKKEFRDLFSIEPTGANAKKMAIHALQNIKAYKVIKSTN